MQQNPRKMMGRGLSTVDTYDPMLEAYSDPKFNSYVHGPGSNIKISMHTESRRREVGGNCKLYVSKIPINVNENGLRNMFNQVGDPLNVNVHVKPNTKFKWGFVEFKTLREAHKAIEEFHKKPPHNMNVSFAISEEEKQEKRRLHEEKETLRNLDVKPLVTGGGGRGRGLTPPMKGIPPKSVRPEGANLNTSSSTGLYSSTSSLENGHSRERFQHHRSDPVKDAPTQVFSDMTLRISSNGHRSVCLGRGYYLQDKDDDSRAFQAPNNLRYGLWDNINGLSQGQVYYTDKQEGIYKYSKEDLTMLEAGNCNQCSNLTNSLCGACRRWYCSVVCLKMDSVEHKKNCTLKSLPNVTGSPVAVQEHRPLQPPIAGTPPQMDKGSPLREYNHIQSPQIPLESSTPTEKKERYKRNNKVTTSSSDDKVDKLPSNQHAGNRNAKQVKKTFVRHPLPADVNDSDLPMRGGCQKISAEFNPQKVVGPQVEPSKIIYPIPEQSFTEVLVILNLDKDYNYWVMVKSELKKMTEILARLEEHCNSQSGVSFEPKVGELCAAKYFGEWFRAVVVSVEPKIRVLFIDFGNEESCEKEDLATLPKDLKEMEPLAFKISLAEGTSDSYFKLEEQSALKVKPVNKKNDLVIVHVEGEKYSEPVDMSCPISSESFVKVNVVHPVSKTVYWVQLSSNLMAIVKMTNELGGLSSVKFTTPPQIGELYSVYYCDSWCRAKIVSTDPLKVFYIDYGNEEAVEVSELRPVPALYKDTEPMAVCIKLAEGTPNKYLSSEYMTDLKVKAVQKLPDGITILVHVEDEDLKLSAHKGTPPKSKVIENELKPVDNNKINHVMDFVTVGVTVKLKVTKMVSDNHLTGSLLLTNSTSDKYVPLADLTTNLSSLPFTSNNRGKLEESVCVIDGALRMRGYVMDVWNKDSTVALVDHAKVVSTSNYCPLPEDLKKLPSAGVRCILRASLMEGVELEGQTLECVVKVVEEGGTLVVELPQYGEGEIVCWEPLVEEAGLSVTKVPSDSKVLLTSYKSPQTVYIQLYTLEAQEMLNTLLQDVATHCLKCPPLERKPLTGEFLACKFDLDGNYYRAQVTSKREDKYTVTFVDYGNSQVVSLSNMKPLTSSLKGVPCFAVKVGLDGVPDKSFSTDAMNFLNELSSANMELFVTYKNNDLSKVTLQTKTGILLNDTLSKLALPRWIKAFENKTDPSEGHVFMAADLTYMKWHVGSKLSVMMLGSISINLKLAANTTAEYLSHITNQLTSDMTKYCEAFPDDSYNPRPNEICIAKFDVDNQWYRAICIKTLFTSSEVLFIDYGNYGEVPHKKIRCMTYDFVSCPIMLKRCTIYGLSDERELKDEAKADLNKVFTNGSVHQVVVVEESPTEGTATIWIPSINDHLTRLGLPTIQPPTF